MDTNPESLEGQPLGTGLSDDEDGTEDEPFTLDDDDEQAVDPSDYDPRSYVDDPTGVDGALSGDDHPMEEEVVNAEVTDLEDLGDLGDIFPH